MLVVERTNTLEALPANRTGAAVGAQEAAGPLSKVFQLVPEEKCEAAVSYHRSRFLSQICPHPWSQLVDRP